MNNLESFLKQLSLDAEKLKKFAEDPDSEMKQAGLDQADIDAIKSRDRTQILKRLQGGLDPAGIEVDVIVLLKVKL